MLTMAASKTKRRVPSLPSFANLTQQPAAVAAAAAGALSGLAAIAMVWLGERGCDALEGRPSCGGIGFLMLVAIIVVVFLLGLYLLRIFEVANAGLVAFFGVTLPLMIILIFLMDVVFSAWMVATLPLVGALCFAGSTVFTSAVENSGDETYEAGATDDEADHDGAGDDPSADDDEDDLPRYVPAAPNEEHDLRDGEGQPLPGDERFSEEETTIVPEQSADDDTRR